jgi:hypothetical protein
MAAPTVTAATFFFDPVCPWTWRTARWLVDVAGRRNIAISYRAFELSDGGSLDEVPEQYRAGATVSRRFLRMVEAAHAAGDDHVVGEVYAAYGKALHDDDQDASAELVEHCLTEAGGSAYVAALDDESLDARTAASRTLAQGFSGDDTGSPVITLETSDGTVGFFGPVIASTPTGDDADRLWDAVVTAATIDQFFELKRRRTAEP